MLGLVRTYQDLLGHVRIYVDGIGRAANVDDIKL